MPGKSYLLVPDPHAYPGVTNERAEWLGQLIVDEKPDVVLCAGDLFDMSSLSDYDKGKRSFQGRSYRDDIEVGLDFHDRMWAPMKAAKKKRPQRIVLEGNHEHRIERALDLSPELVGTIGFKDYQFEDYYDDIVRYDGNLPGIFKQDGILFAHYFPTGISGRPIGGERPANMLMLKNATSCIQFHSHTLDYATRRTIDGKILNCLVGGCYHSHTPDWAGPVAKFWRAGVSILRNVEDGNFDFQWISLDNLQKAYGNI